MNSVSRRNIYKDVDEDTIYVARKFQKQGIRKALFDHLIIESEKAGFLTLQASRFSQNKKSIILRLTCGFREIGLQEKVSQRDGIWYDTILIEKRKKL